VRIARRAVTPVRLRRSLALGTVVGAASLAGCSLAFPLDGLQFGGSAGEGPVDASNNASPNVGPGTPYESDGGIDAMSSNEADGAMHNANEADGAMHNANEADGAMHNASDGSSLDSGVDAPTVSAPYESDGGIDDDVIERETDGAMHNASDGSSLDSGVDAPTVSAPSVPTGLTKTNVTSSSITLSWTASTDPGSGVAYYNVYRNGTKVGTPSSTSFTDTGLSASTSYSYTVSAVDTSGKTSAQSAALSVTTEAVSCSFSVPDVSNGGACTCTGNCYDNEWDGCFTVQNTGSFTMTNPVVTFQVPSNVTDIGTTASSIVPPGFTETASLDTASSTVTISYGGTLAAGASIRVYYSTEHQTEPAATNIAVTASNCR
jgi:cellulose 1,4-beta-cellobiosidase